MPPLNIAEIDWLRAELARLSSNRIEKLRTLLQGLYDAHVQCEGYDPNNPAVQEVQRELGII
jgi:hypothetical protein